MATLITCLRIIISSITGFSDSSGNVSIASILVFISSRARAASVPGFSSIINELEFSREVDVTFFTSVNPYTASSIFWLIPSSISSGAAPGYAT